MAQGNLDRLHSWSSNSHTPHIVPSSSCLDFHHPIHMHLLLHFHDVATIIIAVNHCAKLHCSTTWFVLVLLFSSSKMRHNDTTRATLVVSFNSKGPNKSLEVITTMQQCHNQTNHSTKNNYRMR